MRQRFDRNEEYSLGGRDINEWLKHYLFEDTTCVRMLGAFVQALEERTPLTLRELARNSVRRQVGGVHFAERALALHLPTQLTDFIILPPAPYNPLCCC